MVRRKHRYLVCKIEFADGKRTQREINSHEIFRQIKEAIKQAHGEYGLGVLLSSYKVNFLSKPSILIIRAARDHYRLLQSALFFVKKVGKYDAILNTIHIGGTIRTCQKFYIDYMRKELPTLLAECKTEEERQQVQQAIASCADVGYSKTPAHTQPYVPSKVSESYQHSANVFLAGTGNHTGEFRLPDYLPVPNGSEPRDLAMLDDISSDSDKEECDKTKKIGSLPDSNNGIPSVPQASQVTTVINPRKRPITEDCCDICNVKYNSEQDKAAHEASKKHVKKMKMALACMDSAPTNKANGNQAINTASKVQTFYCAVCKAKMNSQAQYDGHIASKKHRRKVLHNQKMGQSAQMDGTRS